MFKMICMIWPYALVFSAGNVITDYLFEFFNESHSSHFRWSAFNLYKWHSKKMQYEYRCNKQHIIYISFVVFIYKIYMNGLQYATVWSTPQSIFSTFALIATFRGKYWSFSFESPRHADRFFPHMYRSCVLVTAPKCENPA